MQLFYRISCWPQTLLFSTKSNDFLGDISDLAPNPPSFPSVNISSECLSSCTEWKLLLDTFSSTCKLLSCLGRAQQSTFHLNLQHLQDRYSSCGWYKNTWCYNDTSNANDDYWLHDCKHAVKSVLQIAYQAV